MDIIVLMKSVVVGFRARFASIADLKEGHSSNGYSLEKFQTVEEAKGYIERHYPNVSINCYTLQMDLDTQSPYFGSEFISHV